MIQIPQELIRSQGYFLTPIELPASVDQAVLERNWTKLDRLIHRETVKGGVIFDELLKYAQFSEIEFIISIRSSIREPDEDGIWHDDGSRILAFSLSLTLEPTTIEGGKLEIRKRIDPDRSVQFIPTPSFGTLIVFATGHHGFEHKINRVTQGERIIIAGWCTNTSE
jgi:hypothetical protein